MSRKDIFTLQETVNIIQNDMELEEQKCKPPTNYPQLIGLMDSK